MKLRHKLPLAFGAAVLLTAAGGSFGIFELNRAASTYARTIDVDYANERLASDMLLAFKTQVQDWKDVLLKGHDPQALSHYWTAFEQQEQKVDDKAKALAALLPQGQTRKLLQDFQKAHADLGVAYRQGLGDFAAAYYDPIAGDKAAKGIEQEPEEIAARLERQIVASATDAAAGAHAEQERATLASLVLMIVVCAVGGTAGYFLSHQITGKLGGEPEDATMLAREIAVGNLSAAVATSPSDTQSLMAAMQKMQESLTRIVESVRANSDSVSTASAEIAAGNKDLSQRTEMQASNLQQTSASMETLAATVERNAHAATQAAQLAASASSAAAKGGEVIAQVTTTMNAISESSAKIGNIIGVIDGIAFQTNILALNAAVEAARAGEQGRGFAVVASEVRSLAQRSAMAASEIKSLIGGSIERVENGSSLVSEAVSAIDDIVAQVRNVAGLIAEISAATTEQTTEIAEVRDAVLQLDRATQQNSALVEQSAAASEGLRGQAAQLVDAVKMFKLARA